MDTVLGRAPSLQRHKYCLTRGNVQHVTIVQEVMVVEKRLHTRGDVPTETLSVQCAVGRQNENLCMFMRSPTQRTEWGFSNGQP